MNMPFPGMDPYLENPVLWEGAHNKLVMWIGHYLTPLVRPRYVVSTEERVIYESTDEQKLPDLWLQRSRVNGSGGAASPGQAASPIVIEVDDLPIGEVEVRQAYLEILDRYQELKVVTAIEVVSPSNKRAGLGRSMYVAKQRAVLKSDCNLVEIDLLREGRHVLAVPEVEARKQASYDYLIAVSRSADRHRFELYPCTLRDRLPTIAIPLAGGDKDALLDLQPPMERTYDDGSYMLRIKYDEPCIPPLSAEDQAWASEQWAKYKAAHPEWFGPAAEARLP